MLPVEQPFKTYTGLDGKPLDNGYVWFGQPNQNPVTNPVTVYWDAAGTIPAAQPLRTMNGYILRGGAPANVFFDGVYSELVLDAKKRQVFFVRSSDEFSITAAIATFLNNVTGSVGASLIGFIQAGANAIARTIQDKLREVSVSITDYPSLRAAIDALPAEGGVVDIPVGRFPAGTWTYDTNSMTKANVTLRGKRMPGLSANADRLEGGSVIEGRFNVFADNFAIENIGFDFGKYVMDTSYAGYDSLTANHPNGGTWDAFAFGQPNEGNPLPPRRGFRAENVIGLLSRPGSLGHAMLMEGIDGGFVDNVVGVYGVHAVVFKSKNIRGGAVAGWMASTDNVIFKSDTYAAGGNISLATVECRTYAPNCAPWSTPSPAKYGVYLNPATASFDGPIQIGAVKVYGADRGVYISGDANFAVTDVQFGSLLADGYTGAMTVALDFITCRAQRIQIGSLIANNAIAGVQWNASSLADNAQHQVSIGTCKLTNISGFAVRAQTYGRIRIDTLEMTNCAQAYLCDDAARLMIGSETLIGVTQKWGSTAPALSGAWSNFGTGNSTFDVGFKNYGVHIKGLVAAGASPSGTIASLPAYLRPTEDKRFPGYLNAAGARSFALIGVGNSTGTIQLNDNTAPTAGNYVSVDGVAWQHW
jgi:hypothetical protein